MRSFSLAKSHTFFLHVQFSLHIWNLDMHWFLAVIFSGGYQARWTQVIDGGVKNGEIDKYVLNMGRATFNAAYNILYAQTPCCSFLYMYAPYAEHMCAKKQLCYGLCMYWRVIDSAISMENMFWSCLYHTHIIWVEQLNLVDLVNAVAERIL
jgi:hypothetical protein